MQLYSSTCGNPCVLAPPGALEALPSDCREKAEPGEPSSGAMHLAAPASWMTDAVTLMFQLQNLMILCVQGEAFYSH